jgi:hypothetical protein
MILHLLRRFNEWLLRGLTPESQSPESDNDGSELLADEESNTDKSDNNSAGDSNSSDSDGYSDYY